MDEKRDIYHYDLRIENNLAVSQELSLSDRDKELNKRFHQELVIRGLSKARISIYTGLMRRLMRKIRKNIEEINEADVKNLILELMQEKKASETISMYITSLRKFHECVLGSVPKFLDNIKIRRRPNKYSKEVLSYDDVKKLIDAAENLRDKALVSFLYESGARAGELLNMKKKDITFDEYGALVGLDGKTGYRPIRIVASVPYLSNYITSYLQNLSKEDYLWVVSRGKNRNTPIGVRDLLEILKRYTKKSNTNKPFNPHHFRHSRATELASAGWNEREMCIFFGWSPTSRCPARYCHLSARDISNRVLVHYGIKPKDDTRQSKPVQCTRCNSINVPDSKFCSRCSMVLDIKAAQEVIDKKTFETDKMDWVMDDPEVRALLKRKFKERGEKFIYTD